MAFILNPFERLLGSSLSPSEQACVRRNCQNPDEAKRHRHRVIRFLEGLGSTRKPTQGRLASRLTGNAPARKLHAPLICALAADLGYAYLAKDLVRGMPIAGALPLASAPPMKVVPAAMNLHGVKELSGKPRDCKLALKATQLTHKAEMMGSSPQRSPKEGFPNHH